MKINLLKHELTVDDLKRHIQYDPDTGHAYRLTRIIPKTGTTVNQFKLVTGRNNRGYRWVKLLGETHLVHRLAFLYMTGKHPVGEIDHIDGDRNNNAWVNLRECDPLANSRNQGIRKDCTSGVRGVTFSRNSQKWVARISHGGVRVSLGYYVSKGDAVAARRDAEKVYGYHENHGSRQSWNT